ncbi:hypothetical protein FPRO05_04147 [Fusarium proliferatum]|uniref:PNPLA domain-containing protein n=1 Tax=Gibberella intermedia TaxID=948311 RepID=A0A365MVX0_GIBIN|nr:hypothetical protein FPRO05_04147 [Fusarium proliferatum]
MWLRDFLPEHEKFKNSRIMTFGYDSDLTDKRTVMELGNWAESLLRSLDEVRTGGEEKKRPLLLVCHSLGGLVAMTSLGSTANLGNIKLSQFGIAFLATPHSGSMNADWSNLMVATAHTVGGVRTQAVETLRPFNSASVWDTAAFLNLDPCPPFRCFAEGRMMRVKGINQHVVTQSSATLGKQQAFQIMNVDHVSICKFESRLGPFTTISMALLELLSEVTSGRIQQPEAQRQRRMFGQPRFQAHAYPPDGGFWWEGKELKAIQHQTSSASTKPFFGRKKELETLEASLATGDTRPKLTVIKGIAGIGKTELLLQFAARQRSHRNVFFLGSSEGETFESVVSKLSTSIGFEMLENPTENQERWRNTPVPERIDIFMTWLGNRCNKDSLFIVDDIEAFGYSTIPTILKYPAHHTLISTRDSNLKWTGRYFQDFRLPPLDYGATLKILESTLEELSCNPIYRNGLDLVAHRVQGHPLAARNAMSFIIEHLATYDSPSIEFSDLFDRDDPEERKTFLDFSFEGRSLWDSFNLSRKRLSLQENHQAALRLLQILPFLCVDNESLDYLFKMDKRWLRDYEGEFADITMLKSSYMALSTWLSKLRENVMMWVKKSIEDQGEIKAPGSSKQMGQIPSGDKVELLQRSVDSFFTLCVETKQKLQDHENTVPDDSAIYQMIVDCKMAYKRARGHVGVPEEVSDSSARHQSPIHMDPMEGNSARFFQLLQSFQYHKVPCDLLTRACEPRPTWSSTGEIVERLPLKAGVPQWLVEFYYDNEFLFNATGLEGHNRYFKSTMENNGVAYLQVIGEEQSDLETIDERILARERIAVMLQAFPSNNAEIIGEEIVDRFMDIVKTSILPLLSSLTVADIEDWLLPEIREERESYFVALLEFLHQVIHILGIESPLIPLPLLRQISNFISDDTNSNLYAICKQIPQILDAYGGNDDLTSHLSSLETGTDQRSNALIGHLIAMLLSKKSSTTDNKVSMEVLAQALSEWRPLSMGGPSTMEYLAANSFCHQSQIDMIAKPYSTTIDVMTLRGLLLSRRNQQKEAVKVLNSTMVGIISCYGPESLQLGIASAELANCYNILRQEGKAEDVVRSMFHLRQDPSLSTRRDGIYLRIALADSWIGQTRYNEAVTVLQSIVDSPNISTTFRMMSALRLSKSQRRMHENVQKPFDQNSALWTGLTLLSNVPDALAMEYVEELACNIAEIPKRQRRDSNNAEGLIEEVNSIVDKSRSLTSSPCWEWYTNLQQDYSRQIAETTKTQKGKKREAEKGIQHKRMNDMGTAIPSSVFPGSSSQEDANTSNEEGPWAEKLVLSFGGGGVSAISIHPEGPAFSSRSIGDKYPSTLSDSNRVDEYLPCHYFDYMAGTSTGGLSGIMLGRLRMSVDQAIDNFFDFCNDVFRDPLAEFESTHFYLPAKYPADKACKAFKKIVMNGIVVGTKDTSELENVAANEPFIKGGRRTRTIAFSIRNEGGVYRPHIWRSYNGPDDQTTLSRSAMIWEVARATSANRGYFEEIKIDGASYLDESVIVMNPSYRVLEEVSSLHNKAPALFVNIGAGSTFTTNPIARGHENQRTNSESQPDSTDLYTFSENKQWEDLVERVGLEKVYRLNAEGGLQDIPFDDWRPAGTGSSTLSVITSITNEYLHKSEVRDIINNIAGEAIRIRRARAKGRAERWNDFVM